MYQRWTTVLSSSSGQPYVVGMPSPTVWAYQLREIGQRCCRYFLSNSDTFRGCITACWYASAQVLREAYRHAITQPRNVPDLDEGSLQQLWPIIRGWYTENDGFGYKSIASGIEKEHGRTVSDSVS